MALPDHIQERLQRVLDALNEDPVTEPDITIIQAPRSMNHMDPDTKRVHLRLVDWAKHVHQRADALGYPTESYYHKWALLMIPPQPGNPPELPDRVAHVDAAVARLGVIDRSVIFRNYLQWRPIDLHKGIAGIASRRNYDNVLKRARWRVDGYLTAIEGTP
jgi:hypothetical protein